MLCLAKYSERFPEDWITNYIPGTGPNDCMNCYVYGTNQYGCFEMYCANCAIYTYNCKRGLGASNYGIECSLDYIQNECPDIFEEIMKSGYVSASETYLKEREKEDDEYADMPPLISVNEEIDDDDEDNEDDDDEKEETESIS